MSHRVHTMTALLSKVTNRGLQVSLAYVFHRLAEYADVTVCTIFTYIVAAEYLATGYKLSDHVLERAIALDNKHGISSRFVNYIQQLDTQLGMSRLQVPTELAKD